MAWIQPPTGIDATCLVWFIPVPKSSFATSTSCGIRSELCVGYPLTIFVEIHFWSCVHVTLLNTQAIDGTGLSHVVLVVQWITLWLFPGNTPSSCWCFVDNYPTSRHDDMVTLWMQPSHFHMCNRSWLDPASPPRRWGMILPSQKFTKKQPGKKNLVGGFNPSQKY